MSTLGSNESSGAVQCPLWGTKDFDGCFLCRRSRAACKMISDRHYECCSCRNHVRKHLPHSATGPAKSKYKQQLATDEEKYEEHTSAVIAAEEMAASGSKPQRKPPAQKRKAGSQEVEVEDEETPMQELLKNMSRGLEVRECIGVLWPPSEFKEDVGREANKSEIVTINLSGMPHTGVMRPRSFGLPDGCKEVWSTDVATTSQVACLHKSMEAVLAGETEAVTKFAMDKMKVGTTVVKDANNEKDVVVKLQSNKKRKASFDDLDEIWGAPCISYGKEKDGSKPGEQTEGNDDPGSGDAVDGSGQDKAQTVQKPRSRNSGSDPSFPKATRLIIKKKPKGESAPAGTTPSKRAKEVAAMEQALLQCQQAIRCSLAPDTLRSMNDASIKSLITKANARMSGTLIKMYAENGDNTPEMEVLLSLQVAVKKLEKLNIVAPFVSVGKGARPSSGRQLLDVRLDYMDHIKSSFDAEEDRKSCELGVAYLELAVERDLDTYVAAKNWVDFCKLLELTWHGLAETPAELRPYLGLLPDDRRALFKDNMLIKAICNMIRVDNAIDDVRALVEQIKGLPTLRMEGSNTEWVAELDDFFKILWPMDHAVPSTEVSAAKEKLATNKQLRLWRPLALHLTGIEIMKQVATALQQRSQDERHLLQLNQLKTSVDGLSDLSSKTLVAASGAVNIPERPARKNARETYTVIIVKTSAEFRKAGANAEKIQACEKVLTKASFDIISQIDAWIGGKFKMVLDNAAKLAQNKKITKEDIDLAIEDISGVMRKMPVPNMVESFLSEDERKSLSASHDERSNRLRTLMSALPSLLPGKAVKVDEPGTVALHELLEQPGQWLADLQGFSQFKALFTDFLFAHVVDMLRNSVPCTKMHSFWSKLQAAMTSEVKGKVGFLDMLTMPAADLTEISDAKVIAITTTAADNYCAWLAKKLKINQTQGSPEIEMGVLCSLPLIAKMLGNSIKLRAATKDRVTCSSVFPAAEFDGDLVVLLKTIRGEVSGKARKSENVAPLFFECLRASMQDGLTTSLQTLAEKLLKDLTDTAKSADELAKGQVLTDFVKCCDTPWPEASVPRMLEAAGSEEASQLYKASKYLEMYAGPIDGFLKNYGDKLEQQVAKDFQALEFHPQTPRKIAGLLTAVQALGRPLKVGETRAGLLARCRNALTGKDLWKLMPPHVQQMLTQNEKAADGAAATE